MDDPDYLAVPPYEANGRCVFDSKGSRVIVCDEETDCTLRFAEDKVDADPWFMCPNCGRLGQRMVEASLEQCGIKTSAPAPSQ